MAVARASSAESIRTGTEDPYTFVFTPAGTPRGILIAVVNGFGGSVTTSISYGGVPLQNIVSAEDTVTETGRASFWFVGSGIPTGAQTVSHDLTSAISDDIHYVVWEISAAADTEVIDSDLLQENQANPVVTLQKGGRTAICIAAMYGGGAAPGGTLQTGNTLDHTHDLGAFYSQTCFETTVDTADHTIGWSSLASDDLAFVAVAISEKPPAQNLAGTLFTKAPTFNVGAVVSVYNLAGTLFQKAPTFSTGVVLAPTYTNLVVVELDDVGAPDTNVDHFLRAHARTDAGTGLIRLRLFQDSTLIAGFEFEPTGTFATYDYELLEAEAAAITDYNDLQIHIDIKATSTPFTPEIDWVDLQRPVAGVNLAGVLFQKAPTFNTGVIFQEVNLEGVLYQNTPTFSQGLVTAGAVNLAGVLFTKAPTFSAGSVFASQALAGVLFSKAPTFNTGAITATRNLAGVLFQSTPAFGTGAITSTRNVAGVLFQKSPTFPQGAVTVGAVNLSGVLFQKAPAFFAAVVGQEGGPQLLGGTLFEKAPTFSQGAVTTGAVGLTGVLFQKAPTFSAGVVGFNLSGVLYQNAPVFPQGELIQEQFVVGVLFENTPQFFEGAMGTGALDGVLFVSAPLFFVGVLTQGERVFPTWSASSGNGWETAEGEGWPVSTNPEWEVVS